MHMKEVRAAALSIAIVGLAAGARADSPGIGFGDGMSMDAADALRAARASGAPMAPRIVPAGYVAGDQSSAAGTGRHVEWVTVDGGRFIMGSDDPSGTFDDARPAREVSIETFEMSKTVVTVDQYADCVSKGACTAPATGGFCNWGEPGRGNHPVNCVDWRQAEQFARFMGARLPSEAEWEYAATSGGKNQRYPWGNEPASCDRAVMHHPGGSGCGTGGTMAVCSKPAGNAKFPGGGELCDAVGNVWQWVQDEYRTSYAGAPADGRAVEGGVAGSRRVLRGGSFLHHRPVALRADRRYVTDTDERSGGVGFRIARTRR